ncbi:MAG: hypothetical protein HOE90_22080 [Bacteriovoracaceae bacterium]|jgi:hypothetical protein|nr:hypothetical protein [Bacteriovoracaceae bacterium]
MNFKLLLSISLTSLILTTANAKELSFDLESLSDKVLETQNVISTTSDEEVTSYAEDSEYGEGQFQVSGVTIISMRKYHKYSTLSHEVENSGVFVFSDANGEAYGAYYGKTYCPQINISEHDLELYRDYFLNKRTISAVYLIKPTDSSTRNCLAGHFQYARDN